MSSTRLPSTCAWRTALWGLGLEAGLGAAYRCVAASLGMLVIVVLYATMGPPGSRGGSLAHVSSAQPSTRRLDTPQALVYFPTLPTDLVDKQG